MAQDELDRSGRRDEGSAAQPRRKRLVPWNRGLRVLLVEDDPELRQLLASALRGDGYGVIEAADGEEAVDWLGVEVLDVLVGQPRRLPDLIVSDICLPFLSGLDLLEVARLPEKPIPVILITGFGDAETHERARQLGAVCVLDKPFATRDLRASVRQVLRPGGRRPPWERDGHVV